MKTTAANGGLARLVMIATLLLPLALAATHRCFAPPVISHDTAIGLKIWSDMERGGRWNEISVPNDANIATDTAGFVAWWSPGQYLPAGLLIKAGLSVGSATLLIATVGAWSLALGLSRLVLSLGCSRLVAAWSALAAVSTWHTLYVFGMFIGGEVALLAVWPWIAFGTWCLRAKPLLQCWILPALFLAGSMAKLSFGMYAVALSGFLWLEEARAKKWFARPMLITLARLGLVLAVYFMLWHFLFTSRGPTPTDAGKDAGLSLPILIGFSSNSAWFSAVGAGALLGRWFMSHGLSVNAGWRTLVPGLLLTGLVAMVVYVWLLRSERPLLRLAGCVALVASGLLSLLLLRRGGVSLEDRHLRPAGILLLAAALQLAVEVRRKWLARTLLTSVALACTFGIASAGQRLVNIARHTGRAANETSIPDLPGPALRRLESLDRTCADGAGLIYLPRPELALLVPHCRVILGDPADPDSIAKARHGRVPCLVVVLPAGPAQDGSPPPLLGSFVDYREAEWARIRENGWDFWFATSASCAPAI